MPQKRVKDGGHNPKEDISNAQPVIKSSPMLISTAQRQSWDHLESGRNRTKFGSYSSMAVTMESGWFAHHGRE